MRKVLSLLVLLIWCALIFGFSAKSGNESGSFSNNIITRVISVVSQNKMSDEKINEVAESLSFPVRKLAHFFEYFMLGIIAMNVLYNFNIRRHTLIIVGVFCILYAITDETHQLFIEGRSGQISDVLLDSSGSLLGTYFFHRLFILRGLYAKKNN